MKGFSVVKKFIYVFICVIVCCSFSLSAFADTINISGAETPVLEVSVAPESACRENVTETRSSSSFSFSLSSNTSKRSSETYYITQGSDYLTINSLTWTPSGQNVAVGFYNVNTDTAYTVTYSGGSVVNGLISTSTVPTGEYKIYVRNAGSKSISGSISYSMS